MISRRSVDVYPLKRTTKTMLAVIYYLGLVTFQDTQIPGGMKDIGKIPVHHLMWDFIVNL